MFCQVAPIVKTCYNIDIKEYFEPGGAQVGESANIYGVLVSRVQKAESDPNLRNLVEFKDVQGKWQKLSAAQFKEQVDNLAAGLLALGIKKGDPIAIISATSLDWIALDFALLSIGALSIPVYESSSTKQIEYIFQDARIKFAFVQSDVIFGRVESATQGSDTFEEVFILEKNALEYVSGLASSANDEQKQNLKSAQNVVKADDLATIVYTSGSTGTPKGVELTHRNFLSIIENGLLGVPEILARKNGKLLLFLPLAHVFARYAEFVSVAGTTCLGVVSNVATLLPDLATFKPTFLLGVPRVYEKVVNAASQKAGQGVKQKIFGAAVKLAIQSSKLQQKGKRLGKVKQLKYALFDKLVYAKIRHVLGGSLEYAVSGGAPIDADLAHFFIGAGVELIQGYGLTETVGPAIVNRPDDNVVGTIGRPLPGVGVRISDQGEILIKAESAMKNYHNLPDDTNQAFEDQWFKTGDLGELDDGGHITITGRIKDIVVTAGGKNISPAPLEIAVCTSPIISACVVVGDNRPFISALITLDGDNLKHFLESHNIESNLPIADAKNHPAVRLEIDNAIAKANTLVSKAESIRKYFVLDDDFTEANGQLTASMKVRRSEVLRLNKDLINRELYAAK